LNADIFVEVINTVFVLICYFSCPTFFETVPNTVLVLELLVENQGLAHFEPAFEHAFFGADFGLDAELLGALFAVELELFAPGSEEVASEFVEVVLLRPERPDVAVFSAEETVALVTVVVGDVEQAALLQTLVVGFLHTLLSHLAADAVV